MKLIKVIELPLKSFTKRFVSDKELHIKEPTPFELEQAMANCRINNLDTIYVYKGVSDEKR